MGFAEILTIIKGVLQFPGIILEFVKLLQKTPQETHDEILKNIREETNHYEESGRPTWD